MRRAIMADAAALLLFFTLIGVLNACFLAGMAWNQVLHARVLGAAFILPVGRPYGILRDWVSRLFGLSSSDATPVNQDA